MSDLTHETPAGRCSDLTLDRLLAGELDEARAAALEAHLAHAGPCRARYEAISADREAFLSRAPRLTVVPLGRTPPALPAAPRRNAPWRAVTAAALALAASFALWLPTSGVDPATRTKGGGLVAYRARGEAVDVVGEGGQVAPGDRLKFAFPASRGLYAAVVGQDGTGAVSLYFPAGGPRLARVEDDAGPLPGAIALDDAPGREQLFGFACESDLAPARLVDAVKAAPPGALPAVDGCTVSRLSLDKRRSPSGAP
jgi:hypothetical protein